LDTRIIEVEVEVVEVVEVEVVEVVEVVEYVQEVTLIHAPLKENAIPRLIFVFALILIAMILIVIVNA
jgi:hypothetical protein